MGEFFWVIFRLVRVGLLADVGDFGDWWIWGRMEHKWTSMVESICVSNYVGWGQLILLLMRGLWCRCGDWIVVGCCGGRHYRKNRNIVWWAWGGWLDGLLRRMLAM